MQEWMAGSRVTPGEDPEDRERRKLLNILLAAFGAADVLGVIVLLLVPHELMDSTQAETDPLILWLGIAALAVPVLYLLNRSVSRWLAAGLFLSILIAAAVFSDEPIQVIDGRGLLLFSLPIFLSSLLLRSWASFPAAALSSLALVALSAQTDRPLPNFYSILVFFFLATIAWLAARGLSRAADQLRFSEAQLRLLANNLPALVAYISPDQTCRFANSRFSDYFSASPESVVGKPLREVLDEDGYALVRENVETALAGERVVEERQASFRKVGQRWLEVIYVPDKDGHGRVRGLVIMANDATERRRQQEVLRYQDQLLSETGEIAKVGGWEFDPATLKGTWTDAVARIHDLEPGLDTNAEYGMSFYQGESRRKIEQAVKDAIELGQGYDLELEMVTAKGNHKWVRTIGNPVVENGVVVRVRGSFQDITDHRRAEEKLRASEARYRSLFENMLEGYAYCRMVFDESGAPVDFTYLDVNLAFEKLTGLADVVGRPVSEVIPGIRGENPELFEIYGRVARTGAPERFETYLDALKIWFSVSVFCPARGEFVAVFDNVTERKQAEAVIRESEERFRGTFEQAAVGVAHVATDGRFLRVNRRLCETLGYSADELASMTFEAITYPEDLAIGAAERQQLLAGEIPHYAIEKRYIRKDGSPVWINLTVTLAQVAGEGRYFISVIEDISERKRVQSALLASEERYRTVAEFTYDWEYWRAPDGTFVYVSPSCERLTGYAAGAFLEDGALMERITHPDDRAVLAAHHSEAAVSGEQRMSLDIRIIQPDGELRWVSHSCLPVFDRDGHPLGRRGSNRDITDRKLAEDEVLRLNADLEQRVRDRSAELSDLYNHAPCGYHSLDAQGVIVRVNDTELEWLGFTREEMLGKKHVRELLTPASVEVFTRTFPLFKERGWLKDVELDMVRKDGSILPVRVSASAVIDPQGRFVMSRSTVVDATEQKRAEAETRQAQVRLEAANQELESFAYSVSHDLRAPLRGIDGWSLALLEDYQDRLDEQGRKHLGRIRTETQRMGTLIDDLLRISRVARAEMELGPVDLSALAETIAGRLQAEDPERRVAVAIRPGLTVEGDNRLLEIALSNLLQNAWKFTQPRRQPQIELGETRQGTRRVFFVRDNGVGFDMTYASKLFGAFQRLHKQSEFPGTGIGLATVQRIIHRHGGEVWAEAKPGEGATFYFTLKEGT